MTHVTYHPLVQEEFNPDHVYGNAMQCTADELTLAVAEILIVDAKRQVPPEYFNKVVLKRFADGGIIGYQWRYEPEQ